MRQLLPFQICKFFKFNFRIYTTDGKFQNLQMSPTHFALAITVTEMQTCQIFTSKKQAKSWSAIFLFTSFDGKCQNLQISHIFLRQPLLFQRYENLHFLFTKCRSRSRSATFTITPFAGKCQNLQISCTHFCDSSYRFKDIKKIIFTSKKQVKVTECNFRNVII